MLSRRIWAGLTVLALPLTLLVAPAANASVARSFDLRSEWGSEPHNGQAHAWGTLTWHNTTKVVVTGRINDICPGDNYGAYIEYRAYYMNGGYATEFGAAYDAGGCRDEGGDGKAFEPIEIAVSPRWIKYLHLCVVEFDRQTQDYGNTDCENYYNPYTS
ncbi:hypothetical protein OG394_04325 [Kribbella sp. NBC_01245]|uniref:hypothetical protein n=1 Tax=Kribbella sp. NBC_01245 TaxID=2903578 RepID=UPI002E2E870D|nr:hypothetical protein [Kribbella sp. NBC_01245]